MKEKVSINLVHKASQRWCESDWKNDAEGHSGDVYLKALGLLE